MNKRIKKILFIVISTPVVCLILYYTWCLGLIYFTTKYGIQEAKEGTIRLLYNTDHQSLLEACRKVLEDSQLGKWEKKTFYNIRRNPDPNVSDFPEAILDLNPSYVMIYDKVFLYIEMMGGMHHFGIYAYPENFKKPSDYFRYGDKELIEGLWYHDDGYQEITDYEVIIESLRPENK